MLSIIVFPPSFLKTLSRYLMKSLMKSDVDKPSKTSLKILNKINMYKVIDDRNVRDWSSCTLDMFYSTWYSLGSN